MNSTVRITVEIPPDFEEAFRTERFERHATYREIITEMFACRYGLVAPKRQRKNAKKSDAKEPATITA